MRRGLFLPAFDDMADARLLAELAAEAEASGWDGIFLWDHVQYSEPVQLIADPWICLAAVAMRTERIRLGLMVTPIARRRPWVYARQAVSVDRLSGGRLVLGVGVGADNRGEMAPLGEEPEMRTRAEMMEEGLELLELIFSGEPVEHAGRHYGVSARPFLPRAVQSPRIPIWIGAGWPGGRAIDRAARWDGVFPIGIPAEDIPGLRDRLAARRPAGAGGFEIVAMALPGAPPQPWQAAGADWLLTQLGPRPRDDGGLDPTPPLVEVRAVIEAGPGAERVSVGSRGRGAAAGPSPTRGPKAEAVAVAVASRSSSRLDRPRRAEGPHEGVPARPLRRGLFIAPFDELADVRLLGELASLSERRGWDGVFLWDHVSYPAAVERIADVWSCLTAAALSTERIVLGPMVTPLARRRPWVYARQAVTLDRLSGGRLVLGLGVGGDGNGEMAPLGEQAQMRVRAEMLDEGLDLLAAIFAGGPVDHHGRHYRVSARPFLPGPEQSPRIPVWLGARWPGRRPIARAARWDGVIPVGLTPEDVADLVARIEALRGEDAGPFTFVGIAPAGADIAAWEQPGLDWLLTHLGPEPLPGDGPDEMPSLEAVRAAIEVGPDATGSRPACV